MPRGTVSYYERLTREYLAEIEEHTGIEMHIQDDVCVFEQIARQDVLSRILEIISPDDTVMYDLSQKSDNLQRLSYISRVIGKLRSNFVNLWFIAPIDVIECNEQLVSAMVRVLHHHVVCRPDEKTMERTLLYWINYYTSFKTMTDGSSYRSEAQNVCHTLFSMPEACTIDNDSSALETSGISEKDCAEMRNISLECNNFTTDLQDGKVYSLLIARAFYTHISPIILIHLWNQKDKVRRVCYIIKLSKFLGIDGTITVEQIINGNSTANKLFIAKLYALFSTYHTKERLRCLQQEISECKEHIRELRTTIKFLNVQMSDQRECYERLILRIDNENRRLMHANEKENMQQRAVLDAMRNMQPTINQDSEFDEGSFIERIWCVYQHNIHLVAAYECKLRILEAKNDSLRNSNQVLKDIMARYMSRRIERTKKTSHVLRRILRWLGCCCTSSRYLNKHKRHSEKNAMSAFHR